MRVTPRRPLPADVAAAFGRWVAQLTAAGVPAGAARPGTMLSDAPMLDAHGAPTSLRAATAARPAVIVFYRGAWCPYCNLTLRAYQDQLYPALTERGIALIAVSPQKADGSLTAQEKMTSSSRSSVTLATLSPASSASCCRPEPGNCAPRRKSSALTCTLSTPTAPRTCRCPPSSSSTPRGRSAGSTSTPTTPRAPRSPTSSPPRIQSSANSRSSRRADRQRGYAKRSAAERSASGRAPDQASIRFLPIRSLTDVFSNRIHHPILSRQAVTRVPPKSQITDWNSRLAAGLRSRTGKRAQQIETVKSQRITPRTTISALVLADIVPPSSGYRSADIAQ